MRREAPPSLQAHLVSIAGMDEQAHKTPKLVQRDQGRVALLLPRLQWAGRYLGPGRAGAPLWLILAAQAHLLLGWLPKSEEHRRHEYHQPSVHARQPAVDAGQAPPFKSPMKPAVDEKSVFLAHGRTFVPFESTSTLLPTKSTAQS